MTINSSPSNIKFTGIDYFIQSEPLFSGWDRGSNKATSNPIWRGVRTHNEHYQSHAFAALKKDGSIVVWGVRENGGKFLEDHNLNKDFIQIFTNGHGFAAINEDGGVFSWGTTAIAPAFSLDKDVVQIFSTAGSFAALKKDGSIITEVSSWQDDSHNIKDRLRSGVISVFTNYGAFAALKEDGSVVTWGGPESNEKYEGYPGGGDSTKVSSEIDEGVIHVTPTWDAFAALKEDGSVVTWGNPNSGGDSDNVRQDLERGVTKVFSNNFAFAALKDDGSVITWGDPRYGGDSNYWEGGPNESDRYRWNIGNLESDVVDISSTTKGFAALKKDGSVVLWGINDLPRFDYLNKHLNEGVKKIFSNHSAFAALKEDGSVITWGHWQSGADSSEVANHLKEGVIEIFSTSSAFAALKKDGSVITWGLHSKGHMSSNSTNTGALSGGVKKIFSNKYAFAGLKEDGSVITWGYSSVGGDVHRPTVADELKSDVIGLANPLTNDWRRPGFNENIEANSKVASLSTIDRDLNDTHIYSLVKGSGDIDNSYFTINGSSLLINHSPDYETKASYKIRIQTTDRGGDTYSKEFILAVNNLNEFIASISGTSGTDNLESSSSNDSIDGGEGTDTVTYTSKFSHYSFTRSTDTLQIADQRSGTNDGVDTLKNIEYIQFSDQTVEESKVDVVKIYSGNFSDYKFYNKGNGVYQIKTDSGYDDITGYPSLKFTGEAETSSFRDISAIVDIKGTFDQVTGLNTDSGRMFRLYNASFKRLPDADGLKYWIDQFSSGRNTIRVVASSFLGSAEFKQRYGENVSDSIYVNTLYKNVLGRDADTSGLNYWLGQLNSGAETRYEVLLGFSESTENKALFTDMTGFA